MTDDGASRFAALLQRYEGDRDVDSFVSEAFSEDVELLRPERDQQRQGLDGARQFWTEYLDQFSDVRSEFSRVTDAGEVGVLEWRTTGSRARGGSVEYAGVSLLDFDGSGRVSRFATYYDTAAFGRPVR